MQLTKKEQEAREKVCLPLDGLMTLDDVKARIEELRPVVGMFKVGKGSFTRFGPPVVELVKSYGVDVFLDLKFKDIPPTVEDAAEAAAELGVYMFNVHADGSQVMMEAAVQGAYNGAASGTQVPKVIAVTVLTSIGQEEMTYELKIEKPVRQHVWDLARLTKKSGLDGIVCSALDLQGMPDLGEDFMYVTPGIKGPNTPAGTDQKRVARPGDAVQWGSSILVIGRAITAQPTPKARLQAGYEILQDMAKYV